MRIAQPSDKYLLPHIACNPPSPPPASATHRIPMPRASSKAKSKSLPPLPIVAAHIGSSSAAPQAPHGSSPSPDGNPADAPGSAASTRRPRACVTNGCIRTTVTLLVFGAYLVWTWPWHRAHGFEDIPWLLCGRGDAPHSHIWTGTGAGTGAGAGAQVAAGVDMDVDVEGEMGEMGEMGFGGTELGVPASLQAKWGQYAPYRAQGAYVGPPEGCRVTQVNILQRHGARYPNLKEGEQYARAVRRLGSAKEYKDKRLRFLRDYEYDLDADNLTPFGAAQTFESGQLAFTRYRHLVDDGNVPFVRASGAQRVVDSAGNWSVGFAAASRQRVQPYLNVVLPEDANSTLKQDCPRAADGSAQMDTWLAVFAPRLLKRLAAAAPGVELNARMVFDVMAMCPFEAVAKKRAAGPFCALFSEEEWRDFEYHGDVEKYYKDGYGNALGAVQGVGYVNELLARLTDTPVRDNTTHDPKRAFPLGRALYADFTHENVMVPVFAALGLFNVSRALDPRVRPGYLEHLGEGAGLGAGPRHPRFAANEKEGDGAKEGEEGEEEEGQRWIASQMVPFSARMVTERLACARVWDGGDPEAGEYVRILVNDAVQPLAFCGAGERGMCRLEDFVESQGYARRSGDGDFERCYN
ncbi:hypothetical protein GSI_02619 [Ganoderma sinense ZZ0214-1]|uniref:Uncharacterized protein n=1 Tax=Ganoderma sinense ZZ0214-1 TaxID=1077348 RepID=A0A2G8SM32_9APHY|nr:hypothetical protein GSI_02619 [Ganoderma sinense ZZ0214-1]